MTAKIILTESVLVENVNSEWYVSYIGRHFKVNETIALVLLKLREPLTIDEIVHVLCTNEDDYPLFRKNIGKFLYEMNKIGVVRKASEVSLFIPKPLIHGGEVYQNYKFKNLIALDDPFVQVYKATNLSNERDIVIKLFSHKRDIIEGQKQLKRPFQMFEQEFEIMKFLPIHRTICNLISRGNILGYSFAELEFIEGDTLSKSIGNNTIPTNKQSQIALEILEAMAFIHSHDILHGDIHTRNFMVTPDYHIKLIDFGFAFCMNNTEHIRNKGGLTHYMPPERVNLHGFKFSNTHSTKTAEVYQIGLVLLKLFTGKNPFLTKEERTWSEMAEHILNYKCTDKVSDNDGIDFVVKKALSKDPMQRYVSCVEMYKDFQKQLS